MQSERDQGNGFGTLFYTTNQTIFESEILGAIKCHMPKPRRQLKLKFFDKDPVKEFIFYRTCQAILEYLPLL